MTANKLNIHNPYGYNNTELGDYVGQYVATEGTNRTMMQTFFSLNIVLDALKNSLR